MSDDAIDRSPRWRAPLAAAALALTFVAPAFAASDPEAVKIAEHTLAAMGGADAWQATRFIRFNFFGFRLHHWDRYTGRHRLEGKTRDGDSYLVLDNIRTHEGKAWVNGKLQTGEDADKWLQQAYGAWVNDTYWLLMPYKLLDPGVNLAYDGQEEIDGKTYDKLKLTFDNVGLTPGDTYWAYINRETGLMDRWAYFLESFKEGQEPTQWQWLDWQDYGKIKLSPMRKNVGDGSERSLSEIAVFDQLPDEVFTSIEMP